MDFNSLVVGGGGAVASDRYLSIKWFNIETKYKNDKKKVNMEIDCKYISTPLRLHLSLLFFYGHIVDHLGIVWKTVHFSNFNYYCH